MVYYEWSREPRPSQTANDDSAPGSSEMSRRLRLGDFQGEDWLTDQTFRAYLLGGASRDVLAGGYLITLANDTPSIRLRVALQPADRFDHYALQLRSAANAVVTDGSYQLAVQGANVNAAFAPLGVVPLRIARLQ